MVEGFCVWPISAKKQTINETSKLDGQTWYEIRYKMILMPISTWETYKEYIIELCKQYNCDNKVQSWDRTINTINSLN